MLRPARRLPALLLALAALAGCNNPFDPKSDVELAELAPHDIIIYQTQIPGGGAALNLNDWTVLAEFVVNNKVGVNLTSVDITYTDLNGNEVTAYKTTGGRHFKFAYRLEPVTNNDRFDFGEGLSSAVTLYVVDRNVITELQSPAYPSNHFMFAAITFRGEDDNGHDVKLTGTMTIKYY